MKGRGLRRPLAVLLFVSGALFLVGTLVERSTASAPPGVFAISFILGVAVLVVAHGDVLLVAILFGVLAAVFDVLEVVHQAGEGRTLVLVIALVVAMLHAAVALVAGSSLGARAGTTPA